jgi:hypothetical protein
MSKLLEKHGLRNVGSNGQPRHHYKLPYRIVNHFADEVYPFAEPEEDEEKSYRILVDEVICDDSTKNHYLLYVSYDNDNEDLLEEMRNEEDFVDHSSQGIGLSDYVRVMKKNSRKDFDAAVEYVKTLPINPESDVYDNNPHGLEKHYKYIFNLETKEFVNGKEVYDWEAVNKEIKADSKVRLSKYEEK